jgi:hypothetical protein
MLQGQITESEKGDPHNDPKAPTHWKAREEAQKMTKTGPAGNIQFGDYQEIGLYLILQDSTHLVLTRDNIERVTSEYWRDPDKMPPHVKQAVEFQRCPFCPLKGEGDLCDALRPVLPLVDVVDKYVSFDEVTAVYKPDTKELLHVSNTTMAEGLRYVCVLSLMHYCKTGRKYWQYYFDIIPVLGAIEFANRLYLNIHWIHEGNKDRIDGAISEFCEIITITTKNQLARLRLICKNDVFLNAFIGVQTITQLLNVSKDRLLEDSFHRFQKI